MPLYEYVCGNGHTYSERRSENEDQYFDKCSVCGQGFEEVTDVEGA